MTPLLFLSGLGTGEIIMIISVLLLFFGAKKIPELARGLGSGMREFKNAASSAAAQLTDPDKPAVPEEKAPQSA